MQYIVYSIIFSVYEYETGLKCMPTPSLIKSWRKEKIEKNIRKTWSTGGVPYTLNSGQKNIA